VISSRGAWILGLLAVVSIGLNLFLAGTILGGQFRKPAPAPNFEQRLDTIWDGLPDADREVAKQIYAKHRDEIIQKWHLSRTAAQRAVKDLKAKSFSEAEVTSDFAASNDRVMEFRKVFQDMILDVASKISPDGRQRLRAAGGAL
jgi:uncharacterized membrane protein